MIFYAEETQTGLLISSIPAIFSVYFFFFKKRTDWALFFLMLTAFLLRLVMISLDPYLHDWDERFHALVAKHMMDHPFQPMLRTDPVLPYNPEDWAGNHIWVHKQPLFLWQMALSMKLFGANEFAMRLPSAIMGLLSVFMIYQIAEYWLKDKESAFLAAVIHTFAYYQLELTSGRVMLDVNDTAFVFYLTASFWAFIRYLKSSASFSWAIITGVLVGCAILNKWLTGFLIYGGWALFILLSVDRRLNIASYGHLIVSFLTACLTFLPWQFYILHEFPAETTASYEHNSRHFISSLGHPGPVSYHIDQTALFYGQWMIPFVILGLILVFWDKKISKQLSIALLSMVFVWYAFFSLFVETKMPSFTYPVYSLIVILMAFGVIKSFKLIWQLTVRAKVGMLNNLISCVIVLGVAYYALRPMDIIIEGKIDNNLRNNKIENAILYRTLEDNVIKGKVIFNCRSFDEIDIMFYKDVIAYQGFPDEQSLERLLNEGHHLLFFNDHNQYVLPDYIKNDGRIEIMDKAVR